MPKQLRKQRIEAQPADRYPREEPGPTRLCKHYIVSDHAWSRDRTATINQIRAFLIEQGITVRKGLRALKTSFESDTGTSARMRYHRVCARS